MKRTSKFGQTKIPVINPSTGEEEFIIGNRIGDKLIVRASDMFRYELFGLTRKRYEAYSSAGIINVLSANGQPRKNRYDKPFLDINEFTSIELNLADRQDVVGQGKETVYLSVD